MRKPAVLAMSAASILLAALPALAATDYYIKLGGVDGESAKHAAASVDVSSVSSTTSDGSSARAGTGGGTGKVSVQDLSATRVAAPRDAASGLPTGKRIHKPVAAASVDGQASSSAAAAADSSLQTLSVVIPGASSSAAQALDRACASGEHIKNAELGAKGARYQMTDVVVSSCAADGGARRYELRGHVTLVR